MARVAIVEAYPYATVIGGDGVYIDRLRSYLLDRGHEVISIVTDTARGRANPILRFHGKESGAHSWLVRAAVRVGKRTYLSLLPAMILNAGRRLCGARPGDGDPQRAEQVWLAAALRRLDPDYVMLAFGACAFAESLSQGRAVIIALRGFLAEVEHRLVGARQANEALVAERDAELAAADLATFNNNADVLAYFERTGREAVCVGMGFPRRPLTSASGEPIVLFVGAATACNLESLRWFLDLCWPRILQDVPSARLHVVGSSGPVLPKPIPAGVVIIGEVDDLSDEYAKAHIVVAPLVSGSSGVKTKVVEALSYGRALVTTMLGIEAGDREHIAAGLVIADDAHDFAAAVTGLLTDPVRRMNMEVAAATLFDAHYSSDAAYAPLRAYMDWRSVGSAVEPASSMPLRSPLAPLNSPRVELS